MRCFILCAILALVASPAAAQAPAFVPTSVAELVANTPETSTLLAAVQAANLTAYLSNPDLVATVFAPTNEAFNTTLAALNLTAEEVFADTDLLTNLLAYHIVPDVAVTAADLRVQTVLTGPAGELKFNAPDSLLTTSGQTVKIVDSDIVAGNAVVHLIDMVMIPEPEMSNTTMPPAPAPAPAGLASVAELVGNTADTSILLAAVQAAGLTEALSDPDLVATVFAPTNEAFMMTLAALNLTAEEVLEDTELLTTVLTYHVVPGAAVMAADLVDGDAFQSMLAGPTGELTFMAPASLMTTSGQTVNIIATGIMAGKAVVHLIDMVMLPDMGVAMAPAPETM